MTGARGRGNWQRVKIAGHEFWRIPRQELNEFNRSIFPSRKFDDDGPDFLMPFRTPDNYLEFPGAASFEDGGFVVKSGIAAHNVDRLGLEQKLVMSEEGGFSALQLQVWVEDDWFFECYNVLDAHGWLKRTSDLGSVPAPHLMEKIEKAGGKDLIVEAKRDFGDNWDARIFELAAILLAVPFSRVWYAAAMQALYYCHHDDLRLGYLWAEYRMKMNFELFALKHMEMTEKNRESGQKGGQADKKRERYEVLDRLARQKFKALAFASDREFIRQAKFLARAYDSEAAEALFNVAGKPLSSKWYEEWMAHFRQAARGVE